MSLSLDPVDPSWQNVVQNALNPMSTEYLATLNHEPDWLPGPAHVFNAFSLPLAKTRYILFGESPYPRAQSANGYAFWDGAVTTLWSESGLSKTVNRATSLRNLLKMLLVADGALTSEDTSQATIATLDKSTYVQSIQDLFANFLDRGILLLNASLVLSERRVAQDAKAWRPFMQTLLQQLYANNPKVELILLGNIAKQIHQFAIAHQFPQFVAEHPYNISFIHNPRVLDFFQPLQLLQAHR